VPQVKVISPLETFIIEKSDLYSWFRVLLVVAYGE
jgi:hypothetical protein